ncbi:hypothetical protein ACFZBU_04255 [Embleya sp. NPDC008237]|uniref:hypothetical protein n=1 Tax=Embleya sp. NPDC008237 TaxID=3363978 RepID=UPI0036E2300E
MIVTVGIAALFGPIPAGGFLGLMVLLELLSLIWRLVSGHTFGCSAKLATLTVFRVYDYVF